MEIRNWIEIARLGGSRPGLPGTPEQNEQAVRDILEIAPATDGIPISSGWKGLYDKMTRVYVDGAGYILATSKDGVGLYARPDGASLDDPFDIAPEKMSDELRAASEDYLPEGLDTVNRYDTGHEERFVFGYEDYSYYVAIHDEKRGIRMEIKDLTIFLDIADQIRDMGLAS